MVLLYTAFVVFQKENGADALNYFVRNPNGKHDFVQKTGEKTGIVENFCIKIDV